jgi:mevalonate kinase
LNYPFDLDQFESDLDQGLFFNSNIPQQYGLGSSGALVAALFSRYAVNSVPKEELAPEILKADFSILESYFHGKSSGLDPLISFLNKPILIDSKKQICPIEFDMSKSGLAMALIDTKTTGATGPLVKHFIDLFNLPEFELAFQQQFMPANNGCIESLISGDKEKFFSYLPQLVKFQVYQFHEMIPAGFHRVISFAHCEKVYIKLLGSGGGGYLLVFAESQDILDQWSKKRGIELLPII